MRRIVGILPNTHKNDKVLDLKWQVLHIVHTTMYFKGTPISVYPLKTKIRCLYWAKTISRSETQTTHIYCRKNVGRFGLKTPAMIVWKSTPTSCKWCSTLGPLRANKHWSFFSPGLSCHCLLLMARRGWFQRPTTAAIINQKQMISNVSGGQWNTFPAQTSPKTMCCHLARHQAQLLLCWVFFLLVFFNH